MVARIFARLPLGLLALCASLAAAPGCSGDESEPGGSGGDAGDDPNIPVECRIDSEPEARTGVGEWQEVLLEGALCADGTPYRFFVKFAESSHDLAITLEPGGACWDYDSCTGAAGSLSALSLGGLKSNHMTALPPPYGKDEDGVPWGLLFPHLGESDHTVATRNFHQVYFPYCTADVFAGRVVHTYESSDASDSITVAHVGRENLLIALPWLEETFPEVGRLLVLGASAGATGAQLNYVTFRDALEPLCSSLINDSGPLFPPGGPQTAARGTYVERWEATELAQSLDERLDAPADRLLTTDLGHLSALLATAFPDDRFLVSYFLRDLDNPLFAYEGFFDPLPTSRVFELWEEDTDVLLTELEPLEGWGWFLPGFRADNCSHMLSIVPSDELADSTYALSALAGNADGYLRTSIGDVDFGDALRTVVDRDGDLQRLRETTIEGSFTAEQEAACREHE